MRILFDLNIRRVLCVYQRLIGHLHPASVSINRLSRPIIHHMTGDYARLPIGVSVSIDDK